MNYLIAMFLIGVVIFTHELGHFLSARWMKMPVARFSVGFGPKIWSKKRGETEYRLSLIPFGGYVLPAFEDEDEFFRIPADKRIIMTLGGPLAGMVMPVICFAVLNSITGGVSLTGIFVKPLLQTVGATAKLIKLIFLVLTNPQQLTGIVGMVIQGGKFVGADFTRALNFLIVLNLQLSLINMLPLPILDGGKVLLYLLEKANSKLLKLYLPLSIISLVVLIGLMVYTTIIDIGRYVL